MMRTTLRRILWLALAATYPLAAQGLAATPADSAAPRQAAWVVEPQPIDGGVADKGINVLVDSSHDLLFLWMWQVRGGLRGHLGYRTTGNEATLSTVLGPGATARQRDQSRHRWNAHRPFQMAPIGCQYHVVVIYQGGGRQPFLKEEVQALERFMREGGGVILVALPGHGREFPLGQLAAEWGAAFADKAAGPVTGKTVRWPDAKALGDVRLPSLATKGAVRWTVLGQAAGDAPVALQRPYGKGNLIIVSDSRLLTDDKGPRLEPFDDLLQLAGAGRPPDKGPRTVPWENGGVGGAFWPEKEFDLGGIKVLYAANQLPGVVTAVQERGPEVLRHLGELIPSKTWQGETFHIILAAGSPGSGWAVNAYTPKSAAMTCDDRDTGSILSVAAHELAHTMPGPPASDGTCRAGWPPFHSEAHAGYFQRMVGKRMGLGGVPGWWSDPNAPPPHTGVDLAKDSGGKAWDAAWWVWRQIDMKYGEGWYPKWMQRVYERGVGRPNNPVDLTVIIETTSEAVGADVRPIFDRIR
ncbi:MAG TPA: hypothetical protein VM431_10115 [Phycisphaerae bacterium]|nr:hypothetical protein [Phycisphaerae bacterium]